MRRNHCVYVIKRPDNTGDRRCYIGVTSFNKRNSPSRRFDTHKKSNYHVGYFLRKYPDAFIKVVIPKLTKDEAYSLEKLLVPDGYKERKELNLLNECGGGVAPPHFNSLSEKRKKELCRKRSINAKRLSSNPKYKRKQSGACKKKFVFQAPDGNIYKGKGIRDFSEQHGLDHTNMGRLLKGEKHSYKGWICPLNNKKQKKCATYKFYDPKGNLIVIRNLKKFCREHEETKLCYRNMCDLYYGKLMEHKGWTIGPDKSVIGGKGKGKKYKLRDPNGNLIVVTNLQKFCREHPELVYSTLNSMCNGWQKSYKGWTKA